MCNRGFVENPIVQFLIRPTTSLPKKVTKKINNELPNKRSRRG